MESTPLSLVGQQYLRKKQVTNKNRLTLMLGMHLLRPAKPIRPLRAKSMISRQGSLPTPQRVRPIQKYGGSASYMIATAGLLVETGISNPQTFGATSPEASRSPENSTVGLYSPSNFHCTFSCLALELYSKASLLEFLGWK